jgi:hypothetical protein
VTSQAETYAAVLESSIRSTEMLGEAGDFLFVLFWLGFGNAFL